MLFVFWTEDKKTTNQKGEPKMSNQEQKYTEMVEDAPAANLFEQLLVRRDTIVNRMARTLKDTAELPHDQSRINQYAADAIELHGIDQTLETLGAVAMMETMNKVFQDMAEDFRHATQNHRGNEFPGGLFDEELSAMFGGSSSEPEELFREREEVEQPEVETEAEVETVPAATEEEVTPAVATED